ncbi:hypothetical protein H5410_026835 [Solanum commersonii]|uniref:DUF4283 domain-containing protein n=1 Tax=Solanum commersonii TaxID=4109 RepID=A0A9J5Z086_SOLCO|nr:hypothetical protein H5410_026835 [Solanum commersonii]
MEYSNGIPRISWIEEEVDKMNVIEGLQFAVIGKFSYGWPDLEDLRNQILKQCKIKGECKIGLLRHIHILMRFNLMEDFELLFSLASAVGKPIQLDMATINRTRLSYAKVKVQLDLTAKLSNYVELEVVNRRTQINKVQKDTWKRNVGACILALKRKEDEAVIEG